VTFPTGTLTLSIFLSLISSGSFISDSFWPQTPVGKERGVEVVEALTKVEGMKILFIGLMVILDNCVWALGRRRDRKMSVRERRRKMNVVRRSRRVGRRGGWGGGYFAVGLVKGQFRFGKVWLIASSCLSNMPGF